MTLHIGQHLVAPPLRQPIKSFAQFTVAGLQVSIVRFRLFRLGVPCQDVPDRDGSGITGAEGRLVSGRDVVFERIRSSFSLFLVAACADLPTAVKDDPGPRSISFCPEI
jgi:hypothetical protein